MRVLIACESSGTVREAFRRRGHDAWSCDLLPADTDTPHHIQDDIRNVIPFGGAPEWDMIIAHPPCTYFAVSGNKWLKDQPPLKSGALVGAERRAARENARELFMDIVMAPCPRIAIENPIGTMSTYYQKPDQIVQPWWFGDEATKPTCLWLKNLPTLTPTNVVGKGEFHVTKSGNRLPAWYNLPPGPDRWKIRSKTFQGIADAMAEQWGKE